MADEVHALTGLVGHDLLTSRGGVLARASWRDALRLNLVNQVVPADTQVVKQYLRDHVPL